MCDITKPTTIQKNKRLFGKLCYLHRQMCRENAKLFTEYGISPVQMHAMSYISKSAVAGKKVCQKDVEKIINLRPSSVSTLLSNLEKDGFIVRTVSEGDARSKYLELTEKGECLCIKDKMLIDSCDGAIEAALDADEQIQFDSLLQKILDSISK